MVSVSKKFGIEKSIGIGFEKFWYRKKYWYRFRKILVSKKVSVLVSKKIGIGKKYRYRYRKKLVSEKSIGIVQILGFVTHCGLVTSHETTMWALGELISPVYTSFRSTAIQKYQ